MLKKWIACFLTVCLLLCGCTHVGDRDENTTTSTQTETTGQDMAGGAEDAVGEGESTPTQGDVSDETKPKEEQESSQPTGELTPPDAVEPPSGTTTPPETTPDETTTPTTPSGGIELPDDSWS